ncbi:hypothetical protein SEA_SAHARA_34 [Gordonia phage Sahara]|uniref:Uncharacterized protein n=1 Tax=Gordonia phage Sahara TaxID=2859488 RepID=A0AAE8BIJ9_9CAUD|nr:hypothetical protein PP498_gp34 [Gordonia phage Sahara]QYW00803.1 hypothetical protein SEA_SAHARA_34 [Gordonia phage Sahara]
MPHAPYAYICGLCIHPTSGHRLIEGSPIEGPYQCYFEDCNCQCMQTDPVGRLDEAGIAARFPGWPAQLREIPSTV